MYANLKKCGLSSDDSIFWELFANFCYLISTWWKLCNLLASFQCISSNNKISLLGNGCGAVGSAVAFGTTDPWFKPHLRLIIYLLIWQLHDIEKRKRRKKKPGKARLKRKMICLKYQAFCFLPHKLTESYQIPIKILLLYCLLWCCYLQIRNGLAPNPELLDKFKKKSKTEAPVVRAQWPRVKNKFALDIKFFGNKVKVVFCSASISQSGE